MPHLKAEINACNVTRNAMISSKVESGNVFERVGTPFINSDFFLIWVEQIVEGFL